MIFIVAAAVGALGYRVNDSTMTEGGVGPEEAEFVLPILGGPALAAVTAALVVVRLLPPRPVRRDLFRQPGFTAGCVALAVTARGFLEAELLEQTIGHDDWFIAIEWIGAIKGASMCILVAWPMLALAGALRAERGWIDQAGRAVAIFWVLSGILTRIVPLIRYTWFERDLLQ